jgi:hypothetical protein
MALTAPRLEPFERIGITALSERHDVIDLFANALTACLAERVIEAPAPAASATLAASSALR